MQKPHPKAIQILLLNFLIWFIPGIFALALLLPFLFILAMAGDGSLLEMFNDFKKRIPKGLLSYLGVALTLSGIAAVVILFLNLDADGESIVMMGTFGFLCLFLSYYLIKSELKRISEVLNT